MPAFEFAHNIEQAIVAAMRLPRSLAFRQAAVLAVIIMQPAERKAGIDNRARQRNYSFTLVLLNASSIHARIDVEKNSDAAAAPLPHLLLALGQNRNAHV